MKKIILSVTIILSAVLFSGYKEPAQNELSAKKPEITGTKNATTAAKSTEPEAKPDREVLSDGKTTLGRQRILFLIKDSSVQGVKSPALWWNYQPGQTGC